MTKLEIIKQLESLREYLRTEDYAAQENDITALTAVIDAAHTGKLYTAFDVIRIVQAAVSDAVCGCGMGEEDSIVTAYEIERDIVSRLAGGDSSERESRGLTTGQRRNVELQITTASNNSSDVSQTAPD
mgnify:CR=1 FL=1|jgi:hypothetical protein